MRLCSLYPVDPQFSFFPQPQIVLLHRPYIQWTLLILLTPLSLSPTCLLYFVNNYSQCFYRKYTESLYLFIVKRTVNKLCNYVVTLLHYLVKSKWSTLQLYSTVNSVQSDEKTFNYGKFSRKMLFLCFSIQINFRHVFKYPPLAHMHILSCESYWLMDYYYYYY